MGSGSMVQTEFDERAVTASLKVTKCVVAETDAQLLIRVTNTTTLGKKTFSFIEQSESCKGVTGDQVSVVVDDSVCLTAEDIVTR